MGTPPLFLLDGARTALPERGRLVLDGAEGRHASRVRRLVVGERLLIGDGRGTVCECVVAGIRSDGLDVDVLARRLVPAPDPRLVLVQALAKGDRGELAVELTTELGVDEIVPWAASRSIVQWRGERGANALARWRGTAREATKQSRRAWAPNVTGPATTDDVVARLGSSPAGLVLHESAGEPLAAAALPEAGDLLVVVGPEGGVSDDELARFVGAGARAVRIGDPVLRTSTAGAAALAVLSARLGRWG